MKVPVAGHRLRKRNDARPRGDQGYEVGIPRQALTRLERYRQASDPPSEDWPVFPTFHRPTRARTARDGLRSDGFSNEAIEEIFSGRSAEGILREYDHSPPAITTDGARRRMKRLSANADVPGLKTEAGEYLELHGGRRGAGDTLVREVGREAAQRLLRHESPETTRNRTRTSPRARSPTMPSTGQTVDTPGEKCGTTAAKSSRKRL